MALYTVTDQVCDPKYLPVGETPPKVYIHNDTRCKYGYASLDVFGSSTLAAEIPRLGQTALGSTLNRSAVVPPFTTLTIYDHVDYDPGTDWPAHVIEGPKIFNYLGTPAYKDANSAKAVATKPWADAMMPCCTGDIDGRWCGAWNPKSSSSVCDARMKAWCSLDANKGKEQCACINSEIKYLPSCFDNKCTNNPLAYKTQDMRDVVNAGCPSIMECNQYISLSDSAKQNVVNRTQMEQKCTSTTTNNGTPVTNTTTNTDPKINDQPDDGSFGANDTPPGSNTPDPAYVGPNPTAPYSPPNSSPYSSQPGGYNPYPTQPSTNTSYPYSTTTDSAASSNKVMGLDPMVLMIILIVAVVFIVIIVMMMKPSNPGYGNQGYAPVYGNQPFNQNF